MISNARKSHGPKIVKFKFSPEEDRLLISLVKNSKDVDWTYIASQLPNRNSRQCRERWQNYLNPDLNSKTWTEEEDKLLLERYKEMGPHWNSIGRTFVGRSGNSVRNRYLVLIRHQQKEAKKQAKRAEADETITKKAIAPVHQNKTHSSIKAKPFVESYPAPQSYVEKNIAAPGLFYVQEKKSQSFNENAINFDKIFSGIEAFFQQDDDFNFLDAVY